MVNSSYLPINRRYVMVSASQVLGAHMKLKQYLAEKGIKPGTFAAQNNFDPAVIYRLLNHPERRPERDTMDRIYIATEHHVSANDFYDELPITTELRERNANGESSTSGASRKGSQQRRRYAKDDSGLGRSPVKAQQTSARSQ